MYTVGETFFHEIYEDEYELSVVGSFLYHGEEYIIAEDFDGEHYVFIYNEDEDDVDHLENEDEASDIIAVWEADYNTVSREDIGNWDDDSYYDRDDRIGESSGSLDDSMEIDLGDDDFF